MQAAIYTRKSTKDDTAASVKTQEAAARAFIATQGWSLTKVYTDDGKSGALFWAAAFSGLKDAAAGAFEAVVLFDLDRFGRHAQKSMEALNALADPGWRSGTTRRAGSHLDSFEGETVASLKSDSAQQYRDHIRAHTRAAMPKAAQGGTRARSTATTNSHRQGPQRTADRRAEATVVRDIYRAQCGRRRRAHDCGAH